MMHRILAVLTFSLLSTTAAAVDRLQLSLGTLGAGNWQISQAGLTLDWSEPGHTRLVFEAARVKAAGYRLARVRLSCPDFNMRVDSLDCQQGQLSAHGDGVKADAVPATLHYTFSSGALTLAVTGITLAKGEVKLRFRHTPDRWQLDADLYRIRLAALAPRLEPLGLPLEGLQLQGQLAGHLSLQGNAAGLRKLAWKLRTREAGYSNAAGNQAGEALQLASRGTAIPRAGDWQVKASLTANQGMLYADPIYLEFDTAHTLSLSLSMDWRALRRQLSVRSLVFSQPGVVNGRLQARLLLSAEQPLRQLDLAIEDSRFPGLYATWLQPWLAGTLLGDLATEGQVQGRFTWADGRPQTLHLTLDGVSLQARNGQFGIRKLQGALNWGNDAENRLSTLAWQDASLYRLQFGAAKLALETGASHLALQQALVLPLFDGVLHVDAFALDLVDGQPNWSLDAMLTPVSMGAISHALEWPPLAGKLSGMIPKVRYQQGELTLGGVLLVQAFDGDITLRNLRVREPLGLVPRLWADARIEHLDLKTLTKAFSFGRIEGRLQGQVNDLYMEAWQPVAFDAVFETPPDDNSRHRISQRAVDNISNLGGAGMAGAVSRSFLRFLEDFPYQRLGIRCRLVNGVCHMGGVAPAENGYYLVQGRWLPPRLDVIGYATEVDWSSLLARLKAVTQGEMPQVR